MQTNSDDLRLFLAAARAQSLSGGGRLLRQDPAMLGRHGDLRPSAHLWPADGADDRTIARPVRFAGLLMRGIRAELTRLEALA